MKLSDFQKPEIRTRNLAAEGLCDANAKKILNGQVDWEKIPMKTCELARGSNNPFTEANRQIAHDALDAAIDRGAFSNLSDSDEEPEFDDDEEEDEIEETKSRPQSRTARRASYATDAAFIAEHLDPNTLCKDAKDNLHDRAYEEQVKNPNRSYWAGLVHFLATQPKGSRIRDIENKVCLSALINKTLAA